GALTAAVVAANYPTLVRAIVLEDPPLTNEVPEQPASDMFASFQGILSLKTMAPEQRLPAARTMNPGWDEVELAPWTDSKVEFDSEVFRHWEGHFSWRELLPRISCPILLVTGDPAAHAIVTPQIAQEAANLWQQGEVLQIQGAGHCIHRDRYAATLPQVLDFLRR